MKSVLIVGYGVVGHNLAKELEKLQPDIYDKYKPEHNTKQNKKYDFCFICVDTPYINSVVPCDTSQIYNALLENDADVYIIKSTVLPGTTDELVKTFQDGYLINRTLQPKHIIFSPEFYGGTQHCNNFKFDFTILGGDKDDCCKVQQLLQDVYDARHIFRIVDSSTAEFSKYTENSYLKFIVLFCVQMYEAIEKFNKLNGTNIKWEDVRELWRLDERTPISHTLVYEEHPYVDSHCLNKDPKALAEYLDLFLLKALEEFNNMQKEKYKK